MNDLLRLAASKIRPIGMQVRSGRTPARRLSNYFAVIAMLALAVATMLHAQKPSRKAPHPETQQPASGPQVHTGTASGVDTDTRLLNMLADHEFTRLEGELDQLPPWQAQFYRGVLANRNNNLQKSIELLEPVVDQVSSGQNARRERVLRKSLAEDYLREGNWAKAAKAYETLESRLGSSMSADEQDEIEMAVKMTPLVRDHPAMTVDPCVPFIVSVSKNPLGLTDVPVFVDARPQSWMLDPTLPFNLISRSHAKEAGLKVAEESVTIHTLRGREIKVHATVVPRFTIGGQITLHNMTAFVYEDRDYYFPETRYQVEGELGYSVMEAMGRVTVTDSNRLYVDPGEQVSSVEKSDSISAGVRFFLDGDQVILALGGSEGFGPGRGSERMFAIDAGGQQTYLTSRFYDEHTSDFAGQKMELFKLRGLPNMTPVPSYMAETIPLAVGKTTIQFHFMPVLTQPIGSAALDDVYGVLGVDALDQLGSYTFDYRTMQFSIRLSEARD
jgi:Aspartyl protease